MLPLKINQQNHLITENFQPFYSQATLEHGDRARVPPPETAPCAPHALPLRSFRAGPAARRPPQSQWLKRPMAINAPCEHLVSQNKTLSLVWNPNRDPSEPQHAGHGFPHFSSCFGWFVYLVGTTEIQIPSCPRKKLRTAKVHFRPAPGALRCFPIRCFSDHPFDMSRRSSPDSHDHANKRCICWHRPRKVCLPYTCGNWCHKRCVCSTGPHPAWRSWSNDIV